MRPGRCVHCLQQVDEITQDHLFPRSWYPATTPANLQKWTIQACRSCNNLYGKLEEDLRLLLSACVDPKSEAAAGIWTNALNSINPERARSPLDAFKRKKARARFLARLREANPSMVANTLPEIANNRPKGGLAVLVPADDIKRFIEKLVRGTIYITERRHIEDDQEVTVALLKPEDGEPLLRLVEEFGELHERGPGIRIRKAVADDARTNAMFVFDIWDQFRFHGLVLDRAVEASWESFSRRSTDAFRSEESEKA